MLSQPNRHTRILIVDDESTLAFFLKQGLIEADHAFIVEAAASGEEALTKLTYNRYDLLITDLKMPGISGFTLVEVARSLHPHIAVIFMTAFGSPEVQEEAKQLRVDAYLTKPFPIAHLQSVVEAVLVAKGQSEASLVSKVENEG